MDKWTLEHQIEQSVIATQCFLEADSDKAASDWARLAELQALQAIAIGLAALIEEMNKNEQSKVRAK